MEDFAERPDTRCFQGNLPGRSDVTGRNPRGAREYNATVIRFEEIQESERKISWIGFERLRAKRAGIPDRARIGSTRR